MCSVLLFFFFRINTFHKNLVIHEQALYLSIEHREEVSKAFFFNDLINQLSLKY